MTHHRLGSWTCPSGNSCDVFVWREGPGRDRAEFQWDVAPPLRPEDEQYYHETILPEVIARLAEFRERPLGSALYINLPPARSGS